jgi:hypothetical protein
MTSQKTTESVQNVQLKVQLDVLFYVFFILLYSWLKV